MWSMASPRPGMETSGGALNHGKKQAAMCWGTTNN